MWFTKLHGLGNDYLFLDGFAAPEITGRADLHELARRMSDRHRGIGADGLILLARPADPARADVRLRIFNADGSEGGVCGNGTRCAAKFLVDRGHVVPRDGGRVIIDSGARLLDVVVHLSPHGLVERATVDMGAPIFELERIPVDAAEVRPLSTPSGGAPALYAIDDRQAAFVSMGNPHMVCFIDHDPSRIELEREGPRFEHHPAFPLRSNVHFVHVLSRTELRMRPWERGSGATLACASGACGVVAAGVGLGMLDHDVLVHMPGGDLQVRADRQTGRIFMTGEAVEVFSGDWPA